MSFSQFAASNFVPLLARLVLAAVFIPAGWNFYAKDVTFHGEDAATLRRLGVQGLAPAMPGPQSRADWRLEVRHASLSGPLTASAPPSPTPASSEPASPPATRPDTPQPPARSPEASPPAAPEAPAESAPPPAAPAESAQSEQPVEASAPDILPPREAEYAPLTARSMHAVTLMAAAHHWRNPTWWAYGVTIFELVGGAMLVIGLFSRLWALGLAVILAGTFLHTSFHTLQDTSLFALTPDSFHMFAAQTGLFVLAFGIVLTGAGAASLDRAIFRRPVAEAE